MTSIADTRILRGVAGALIAGAWLLGLYAASPLVGGFAPNGLAQVVIDNSPGWFSAMMIDLLGMWAQPVLLGSTLLGIVLAAAGVALVWPRLPALPVYVGVLIGVVVTGMLLSTIDAEPSGAVLAGVVIAVAPPYLVARLLETSLREAIRPAERRKFLRHSIGLFGAGVLALGALRTGFSRFGLRTPSDTGELLVTGGEADGVGDPAFDFEGMPAAVTPPEDHYVIDIAMENPRLDTDSWTLDIHGAVSAPHSLTHQELLSHNESTEMIMTMICIGNRIGGRLIGTARWTGVQLSELVEAANPTESAVAVVTHAADGYCEALPIEQVHRDDILIAYGMGGRTLSVNHGFPARLLFPGRYGMKMTKWITDIEIVDREHVGYWGRLGWDEEAIVHTTSYVMGGERTGDRVTVGGVAFGGHETGTTAIAGVDVSVDGGTTWSDAELEDPIDRHAWRRWKHEFVAPDVQEFEIVCRAIEASGNVQTGVETDPHPSGPTGWHRVTETL